MNTAQARNAENIHKATEITCLVFFSANETAKAAPVIARITSAAFIENKLSTIRVIAKEKPICANTLFITFSLLL